MSRYNIENDFAEQKEFDATQEGKILNLGSRIAELEDEKKYLLTEIEGYKASEIKKDEQIEVYGNETRRYARLMGEIVEERDMLKSAIATPELYVGVVEKILAEERELAIADNLNLRAERERLKAEVKDLRYSLEHIDGDERYAKLRDRLERLVAAANDAKGELEYDITNGRVAIDILKDAIAAAEDGCAPVKNQMLSERSLLKNAILFINNEWEKGTYSPEWFREQAIVKIAVEKAKEVVG